MPFSRSTRNGYLATYTDRGRTRVSTGSPTKTILIIDGYDDHRKFFAHRLQVCSPEYAVIEAKDGQAGLALYKSQRIDCVVLELDLPDMSGFQVLHDVVPLATDPPIAVVVLTRLFLEHLADLATTNGAQACLSKLRTSGDALDKAIQEAMAAVGSSRKDSRR